MASKYTSKQAYLYRLTISVLQLVSTWVLFPTESRAQQLELRDPPLCERCVGSFTWHRAMDIEDRCLQEIIVNCLRQHDKLLDSFSFFNNAFSMVQNFWQEILLSNSSGNKKKFNKEKSACCKQLFPSKFSKLWSKRQTKKHTRIKQSNWDTRALAKSRLYNKIGCRKLIATGKCFLLSRWCLMRGGEKLYWTRFTFSVWTFC